MKTLFLFSFLAIFGTYGLGLAGVLEDPHGLADLNLEKFQVAEHSESASGNANGHYTLKAMR